MVRTAGTDSFVGSSEEASDSSGVGEESSDGLAATASELSGSGVASRVLGEGEGGGRTTSL